MSGKYLLHTDGASKGNPGPAGIGIALFRDGESEPCFTRADAIGLSTNNAAEYRALLAGLADALSLGVEEIEARTDSELMAHQINGRYAVKSPELLPLFEEARALLARFSQARVVHVRRELNAVADRLANDGIRRGGRADAP